MVRSFIERYFFSPVIIIIVAAIEVENVILENALIRQVHDINIVPAIANQLAHCLVRLSSVNGYHIVDYSKINVPLHIMDTRTEDRDNPRVVNAWLFTMSKSIRCYVYFLLTTMLDPHLQDKIRGYSIQQIFQDDDPFSSFIQPQYYFFVTDSWFLYQAGGKIESNVYGKGFASLATIFVVEYEKHFDYKVWCICEYCMERRLAKSFINFRCKTHEPVQCFIKMMNTYERMSWRGNNVYWHADLSEFSHIHTKVHDFAFKVGNQSRIKRDVLTLDEFVVPRVLNKQTLQKYSENPWLEFLPIYDNRAFKFITSSGVHEELLHHTYFSELSYTVWLCIGGSLMTVLMFNIILNRYFGLMSPLQVAMETSIWLFATLVEQNGTQLPVLLKPEIQAKISFWRSFRIVLITWSLAGIIITNGYKGMVKSNTALSFPYESNYKILSELHDFTLYVPLEDRIHPDFVETYGGERRISYFNITNIYTSDNLTTTLDYVYDINYESNLVLYNYWRALSESIRHELFSEPYNNEKVQLFLRSRERLSKLYCFQANDTKLAIERFLVEPNTAFITTQKSLPYYWKIFRSFMQKTGTTLRFAHNGKIPDSTLLNLTSTSGFFVTHKIGHYENIALRKLKVLFSSGIYSYWETLEHHMMNAVGLEESEVSIGAAKALSLQNHSIAILCIVSVLLLFTCFVVFLTEFICKRIMRRFC
ncbi:unnamed protein product [Allacma fusca]|uniref:Ionotropic receptor n=1 Tax=Allacma fusca TaxID=39272 RepID=A0A8J2JZI3_9HEXA|nr:unnamed protein product [Allacma fusca]